MGEGRPFLEDLALVLCVAAITTVLFRRMRQPVVLGYLLAGMIVGPHIPLPVFVNIDRVHALSELGVVLVMFSVGLELSVRRLARVLPTAGVTGFVQITLMMSLGYLAAQALGWTARESLFAAAMVAVSSTMIVAKVFADERVRRGVVDIVFGVLVVQDLAAVILLTVLTAVSKGAGLSGTELAITVGKLGGVLAAMLIAGFLVVPRTIRLVARLDSPETLLVASIGLCFAFALLADRLGYSVALGAFVAGSLVAESGKGEQIEMLIAPVRDVFAAIFFVSVGMIVDPAIIVHHWPAVLAFTAVVIIGQVASVSLGSFLSGNDVRSSIEAGMSLAQIGEFSFIIASTGAALGAVSDTLYPVAVAVALVTTFTTPWLVRGSKRFALGVERRLPHSLQTFAALYTGWVERRPLSTGKSRAARLVRVIILDFGVIAAIVVASGLAIDASSRLLTQHTGLAPEWARIAVVAGTFLVSAPFMVGIVRAVRALGVEIAATALPRREGEADLAAAPRRALVLMLQLALLAMIAVPLLALTEPLISPLVGGGMLAVGLVVLGVSFWRSAENLQEHVRAVAAVVAEALGRQAGGSEPPTLDQVQALVPGMGDLTPVGLVPQSEAVGKTLAALDLRGLTGATVIAIYRGGREVLIPTGKEELRAGDILALAGAHDSVEAAKKLLVPDQS